MTINLINQQNGALKLNMVRGYNLSQKIQSINQHQPTIPNTWQIENLLSGAIWTPTSQGENNDADTFWGTGQQFDTMKLVETNSDIHTQWPDQIVQFMI